MSNGHKVIMLGVLAAFLGACGQGTKESGAGSAGLTLSAVDLTRACRAAVAALNGHQPQIIEGESVEGGVAVVAYTRPSDGTRWKNRCKVEGDRVIWSTVDVNGPGSGPGRWRTDPADEVITFRIQPDSVSVAISASDGPPQEETYPI